MFKPKKETVNAVPFPHVPHNVDKGTRRRNLKKICTSSLENLTEIWEWESENWVELYN